MLSNAGRTMASQSCCQFPDVSLASSSTMASSTIFTLIALPVWYTAVEDLWAVMLGLLEWRGVGRRLGFPRGSVLAGHKRP